MPRLSVIVPTVKPWPRLSGPLELLRTQALEADAEVLVLDGHGAGLPTVELTAPFVPVVLPGADVFALRAEGITRARGDIVALIEDHVAVSSEWCARIIEAFDDRPDAMGIVGSVRNGAPRLLDRASFLVTWAPFLEPLRTVPIDRSPAPGVVSYRRSALLPARATPGWLEYELPVELLRRGQLAPDDRVRVTHTQYVGMRAFALHYHSGRGFTGLECRGLPWRSRLEHLPAAVRIPSRLWRQTRQALGERPEIHETPACLAAVAALITCNGWGQVVGVLTAATGESLAHLE